MMTELLQTIALGLGVYYLNEYNKQEIESLLNNHKENLELSVKDMLNSFENKNQKDISEINNRLIDINSKISKLLGEELPNEKIIISDEESDEEEVNE